MDELIAKLRVLAAQQDVPPKIRKRAECLYRRLSTPLAVGIAGPADDIAMPLIAALQHDSTLSVYTDEVLHADIAIWCTNGFTAEEIAYWEAAPAALQDHSLLVLKASNDIAHVQSMGECYFRQSIVIEASEDVAKVVKILMQQVRRGREADEDQAIALLVRYPVALAPDQLSAANDDPTETIADYMQSQANTLASLTLTETAESSKAVLDICVQTMEHLMAQFADLPADKTQEAVLDAADAVTLMALEGDMSAAADAVTVLISLQERFRTATKLSNVRQIETISV